MQAAFHPTYRPDIDGLRAIAVLAIVGFHASPGHLPGGFVGVDIFFVISGFLISSIILKEVALGQFSFVSFYARRVRRIFPALLVVLIATLVAGWRFLLPGEYRQLGSHVAASAAYIPNFLFWSEAGYFDTASELKLLLHLWSLGVEEQFYIIWPLVIAAVVFMRFSLVLVIALIITVSFGLNAWLIRTHPVSTFYLPVTRAWELLIGCGLATSFTQVIQVHRHLANAASVCGLAMIAACGVLLTSKSPFPGWNAVPPTMGAGLVIWAGKDAWTNRTLLSNRMLVFFGLISYPLYLWHWPLLAFPRVIEEDDPSRIVRLAAVAVAIMLAWLTYFIIERGVRKSANNLVATALCAASIVVGATGYLVFRLDGLPLRYPVELQSLLRPIAASAGSNREGVAAHHCFLSPGENFAYYTPDCVEAEPAHAALVILWGDSHSSAIYPGLAAIRHEYNFRIAEFTASACPPLLGIEVLDRPFCKEINEEIFNKIGALRPQVVILHANWLNPAYDIDSMPATLAALTRIGMHKVVLVGAVPIWPKPLGKLLTKHYQLWGHVPERLRPRDPQQIAQSDAKLAGFARNFGFTFVAPSDNLCSHHLCLTIIGQPPVVTAIDYQHLTNEAAEMVAKSIAAHF
jgi:peptidoglycan/LPS O-acetylase OafA/YrhL